MAKHVIVTHTAVSSTKKAIKLVKVTKKTAINQWDSLVMDSESESDSDTKKVMTNPKTKETDWGMMSDDEDDDDMGKPAPWAK